MSAPVVSVTPAHEKALTEFMDTAVRQKHSSYIAVVHVGEESISHLLPRASDLHKYVHLSETTHEIDIAGNTVAHVFSVTKSMLGLAWAARLYDSSAGLKPTQLYKDVTNPDKKADRSLAGYYLSPTRPVTKSLPLLCKARVMDFFTQTTGLHTVDLGAVSGLEIAMLAKRKMITDMNTFNTLLADNFISVRPDTDGKQFVYDNLLTQVSGLMLEDYVKVKENRPDFLIRDDVIDRYFPATLKTPQKNIYIRDGWPLLEAGYKFYSIISNTPVEYEKPIMNTMVLAGLKMKGVDMIEFGCEMLKKHHALLLRIHDDTTLRFDFDTTDTTDERAGWAYSLFFWIPRYKDDDKTGEKWISCIGHQGQYILFELTSRMLFVRQHFSKSSLVDNIDVSHLTVAAAQEYRYPGFASECRRLLHTMREVS